jgi:hypothetical protein
METLEYASDATGNAAGSLTWKGRAPVCLIPVSLKILRLTFLKDEQDLNTEQIFTEDRIILGKSRRDESLTGSTNIFWDSPSQNVRCAAIPFCRLEFPWAFFARKGFS